MWARNLLFLGVVFGGVALLRASLFPLRAPHRAVHFDTAATTSDDFQAVVRDVNKAFRKECFAQGLPPAAAAPDLVVARRLSLALTGTIPSLEEIRQFEAQPPALRIAGWTNHLLADRRFGDYFAERLARAYVGTEDGPFIVYRRRKFVSWLGDELMKNTSYGDLVRQLIAAEGLSTDQPAVNFITVTVENEKLNPERLAGRVARAFLGLRIDCAQCHDHFLEKSWKQTDFQALAAFFGQTKQTITNIHDGDGEYQYENRKTGARITIEPAVPEATELLPTEGTRRQRLAAWVTHPQNPWFARGTVNRIWALMFNRPLLPTVESSRRDEQGSAALDILARDFTAHNYDLHRLIRLIAATEVFHRSSVDTVEERLPTGAAQVWLAAGAHALGGQPELSLAVQLARIRPEITEVDTQTWAVFPITRLRPEQVIGSVIQAASVQTITTRSHIFVRAGRYFTEKDFVKRYGDTGDDEFDGHGGTIPQRLLMMNGNLVDEQIGPGAFNAHASSRIAQAAPNDHAAVDAAYLCVLTRRPTPKESDYFTGQLAGSHGDERDRHLADLYWALFNATEMSWNH